MFEWLKEPEAPPPQSREELEEAVIAQLKTVYVELGQVACGYR